MAQSVSAPSNALVGSPTGTGAGGLAGCVQGALYKFGALGNSLRVSTSVFASQGQPNHVFLAVSVQRVPDRRERRHLCVKAPYDIP